VPELDFSQVAQEREEFGITLMDGERVVLPKILDTYAVLEIMGDRTLDEVKKLPDDKQNMMGIQMLKAILGEENFRKCINGIPRDKQQDFARKVFEYYGMNAAQEEGKAQEPETEEAPDQSPSPTERSTTISDISTPTLSDSIPQPGGSSTEEGSTSESSLHGLAPSPLSRSS